MAEAANALAKTRNALYSILDGLSAEDWGALVAAGYRLANPGVLE